MIVAARLLILGIVTCALSSPALAQQRGSIAGKVVDPAGLALPGATITVIEQNTGFTRTVVTADTGAFSVPNLEPGLYTITVEMSGFASDQADRPAAHLRPEHSHRSQDAGRRTSGRGRP